MRNNKGISAVGFKALTKCIKKNTHIDHIDLSDCSINLMWKFEIILDDISQNCSLTQVVLDNQNISPEFLEKMNSELAQNKSIANIIMPTLKEAGQ